MRTLQDFVDKDPKAPAYRYQLANVEASAAIQVMKSDPGRETILCRQAAANYKEILKTTASAAPSSTDVWLRLGVMQRELGEYEPALASFEQAAAPIPTAPTHF